MTPIELTEKASHYRWYHPIDLGGYVTKPENDFSLIWDFIQRQLNSVDFMNKSVLDIGCRDGLWSLFAEEHGASLIRAIDNDVSKAATELALPVRKSKVHMTYGNATELHPEFVGEYDMILMLGLLYHLRFPMTGLYRAKDCLKKGGLLCIETALYMDAPQDKPMLYCPFMDSPYEAGSVSFFNRIGLITTLESMGMKFLSYADLPENQVGPIRRAFLKFEKGEMFPHLREYWTGLHTGHTSASEKDWQIEAAQRYVSKSS